MNKRNSNDLRRFLFPHSSPIMSTLLTGDLQLEYVKCILESNIGSWAAFHVGWYEALLDAIYYLAC